MAAISSACQQRIALNDGRTMPSFGLGVWQAPLGACKAAVLHALRCGYRHIDTAEVYGNEQDVGDALAIFLKERPDVQREDIWITTKFSRAMALAVLRSFGPVETRCASCGCSMLICT